MKNPLKAPATDRLQGTNIVSLSHGNGSHGHYESRQLSQKVLEATEHTIILPPMDIPLIRAIAISSGREGESQVRKIFDRRFKSANAELEEETHALVNAITASKTGAERRKRGISKEMEQTDPYLRIRRDGTPWTYPEWIKLCFFIVLSMVLLFVGINSNALVLMASGISVFESPWRAYTFSFIPIGLAAALKALGTHIESRNTRRQYTIAVWVVGLLAGLVWARLFAATFPGLTQTAADIVNNLATSSDTTGSPTGSGTFVFCAMFAESFLSAGCWLTAQTIAEAHQLNDSKDNPAYLKLQQDLDFWSNLQIEHSQLQGRLTGKLRAIDDTGMHYLETAVNYFRAALKSAVNNQHLEDLLNG